MGDANGDGSVDAGKTDTDGDGIVDQTDDDIDGDGIKNEDDADADSSVDGDKTEKKTVVTEINSLFIVFCIAGSLVLILVILLVIRKMGKKKNKFYEKTDEIGDAVAIEIEMKPTPNNSLNETKKKDSLVAG